MGYKTNSYWIWAFGVSKLNNHELCARLTRGLEVTDLKTIIFVTRSCWGRHADWIIEDAPGGNEGICFKGLGYLSRKLHYWFSLKWKAARKSEFIKKNSLGQSVCILLLPDTVSFSLFVFVVFLFVFGLIVVNTTTLVALRHLSMFSKSCGFSLTLCYFQWVISRQFLCWNNKATIS